jgi:hypothetical protein
MTLATPMNMPSTVNKDLIGCSNRLLVPSLTVRK